MSKIADKLFERLRDAGIPEPEKEYKFAPVVDGRPVRGWKFDGAWPDKMVAVEVDGGTFMGGRHTRGAGHVEDALKRNVAQCMGWKVIVLGPRDQFKGRAARHVQAAFGDGTSLGELMLELEGIDRS